MINFVWFKWFLLPPAACVALENVCAPKGQRVWALECSMHTDYPRKSVNPQLKQHLSSVSVPSQADKIETIKLCYTKLQLHTYRQTDKHEADRGVRHACSTISMKNH